MQNDFQNYDFDQPAPSDAESEDELLDDEEQETGQPADFKRRRFASSVLGVCGIGVLTFGVSQRMMLSKPFKPMEAEGMQMVLAKGNLPAPGAAPKAVRVKYQQRDGWRITERETLVYVLNNEEQGLRVLSAACPHAGCFVEYQRKEEQFACPCHRATFSAEGKVQSGPPPSDLPVLESELRGDGLYARV